MWPVATGVEYLHTVDLARKGTNPLSVLRTWLDSASGPSTLVVPAGTDPRSLHAAAALPAAATVVTGLHGELARGSSLVLLWPGEATLDIAAFYLNKASRVLVLLGDDGPTITGWLRRHRATHMADSSVLTALNGVLAEPAVEYGLRYLLGLPVRGLARDAFCHEPAKSRAISAFQAFHRGGVPVEAGPLLLEFLVSNGAGISDAHTLNDYARQVTRNTEIPTHAGHGFRDDILQVWRARSPSASVDGYLGTPVTASCAAYNPQDFAD